MEQKSTSLIDSSLSDYINIGRTGSISIHERTSVKKVLILNFSSVFGSVDNSGSGGKLLLGLRGVLYFFSCCSKNVEGGERDFLDVLIDIVYLEGIKFFRGQLLFF